MHKKTKIIFLLITILFLFIPAVSSSYADPFSSEKLEQVAVVLVVDTSGSMKKTDPQNLRGTASDIFIDLLSPEDYLGVITFNTSVETVLPVDTIGNGEKKRAFQQKLSAKLVSTGDTNYHLALSEAMKQLDGIKQKNIRKIIVFLTDGRPDPDPSRSSDTAFMDNYMHSLWSLVYDLSLRKYPVYSVGLGQEIDPGILKRISLETGGEYQVFNDSAELASGFFKILSNLKNRNNFLNTESMIKKEKNIGFEFDRFTSQITMVFTYPASQPMDVSLIPPAERKHDKGVYVQKTNQYTIITLNGESPDSEGKWTVKIMGNGTVKIYGAKDLIIKTWIEKPFPNDSVSIKEPIEIEAIITGADQKDLYVEASVKKNGVEDVFPVSMNYSNGTYRGIYKKTDQAGTYDISIKVFRGGKLLTVSSVKTSVKILPSLETDFYTLDKKFLSESTTAVTSWLSLSGNRMKPTDDIKIQDYRIKMYYEDGREESFILYDNGLPTSGDVLPNDGVYSCYVKFTVEGETNADLIVNGAFRGESLQLRKSFDRFRIDPPGSLNISMDIDHLFGRKGDVLAVPLILENKSGMTEIISLSTGKSYGFFQPHQVSAEAGTVTEALVSFHLNKDLKEGTFQIPVRISSENPQTRINSELSISVEVVSDIGWFMNLGIRWGTVIIPFILFPPLILLTGLLLYRILVYPETIVRGTLHFHEGADATSEMKKLNLKAFRKSSVRISLNDDGYKSGDHVFDTSYRYAIIFKKNYERGKWNFIEGYKALGKKASAPKLILEITEPGIFQCNGIAYSKKELFHGDIFETAGYTFQYLEDKKEIKFEAGQDLLEGKI